MKKPLKLLALSIATWVICTNLAWSNNAELEGIAKRFFIAATEGDQATVLAMMSPTWKENLQIPMFERFMHEFGLDDFQGIEWGETKLIEGGMELNAQFSSSTDQFPIQVVMESHDKKWLILRVSVLPKIPQPLLPEPSYEETVVLVSATMREFADSMNAKTMKTLYQSASRLFRIRHSLEESSEAFKQYFGEGDFHERVSGTPGLARPTLKDNYLIVEGGYNTGGFKTRFKLDYVAEGDLWKIIGVGISSNPDDE